MYLRYFVALWHKSRWHVHPPSRCGFGFWGTACFPEPMCGNAKAWIGPKSLGPIGTHWDLVPYMLLEGCNGCNWHTACYTCFDLGHLVFLTCLQHVGNSDFEAHRTCLVLGSQNFHPKHIKNCKALAVKFSLIRFGIDKLSKGPHPIGNWYR